MNIKISTLGIRKNTILRKSQERLEQENCHKKYLYVSLAATAIFMCDINSAECGKIKTPIFADKDLNYVGFAAPQQQVGITEQVEKKEGLTLHPGKKEIKIKQKEGKESKHEVDLLPIENPLLSARKEIKISDKHIDTKKNTFQLSLYGAAFSQFENGVRYDYYHIAHDGIFSPSDEFSQHKKCLCLSNPLLIHEYTLQTYPIINKPGSDEWVQLDDVSGTERYLWMLKSSPTGTISATTYTTSLEVGVDGNAGSTGPLPSGGLGGHLTLTHTKTRTIDDVFIEDKALSQVNDAKWVFKIRNPDVKNPTPVSESAFTPYVQLLWKVNYEHAVKNNLYYKSSSKDGKDALYFAFNNAVSIQFIPVRKHLGGFACASCGTHESKPTPHYEVLNESIAIKVPPEPKNK